MSAEVETMSYRMASEEDRPWHGIGSAVDHDATPGEMLVASGLDWTVSKRRLLTTASRDEGDQRYMSVPDYFALVRDKDNKVLGPAGKDYVPTQNSQAFDFFKKFCDAGGMRMETAGSLQGGKNVWVLAGINDGFELAGGDKVGGYLLLNSPHVWGKSLIVKFTAIRVVCANTLVMALGENRASFRAPHVRAFDESVAAEAETALGLATENLAAFRETAELLARTKVEQEVAARYVADLVQPDLVDERFGPKFYARPQDEQLATLADVGLGSLDVRQLKKTASEIFGNLRTQPGANMESSAGTLWGCFNAVTYYADHQAGRDRDNALWSAWFGPKGTLKARALERAEGLAMAIARR